MHGKRSGSVPRKTIINDQPHMLAYINPEEAMMLKSMGGTGQPGPGGVPAFPPAGDYGYDGGAGQGEAPGDVSFDAFGDAYGTQEAAQAADMEAQQAAAQAGFEEGFGQPTNTDALSLFQQKIDTPVEQTGILGTLSKFSPMHMAGRALNKAQMQSAYNQLAGKSTPNQGFLASIGKSLGITPEITGYQPVFDDAGNIVGSAGMGTAGNVVGYRGERTGSVFGPEGIQDYVDAMNAAGQGGPDSPGGSEGPPPIIVDDEEIIEDDPDAVDPYVVQNLDIIQPTTLEGYEVPSIYKHGGIVSLDPFKQLARNNM
jgi:hypothetical protein